MLRYQCTCTPGFSLKKLSLGGRGSHLNFISFSKFYMLQDERWSCQSIIWALWSLILIMCDKRDMSSIILLMTRLHGIDCCLKIKEFCASQILHMTEIIAKGQESLESMWWWLRLHKSLWPKEMFVARSCSWVPLRTGTWRTCALDLSVYPRRGASIADDDGLVSELLPGIEFVEREYLSKDAYSVW
jgi:hypothetical protein